MEQLKITEAKILAKKLKAQGTIILSFDIDNGEFYGASYGGYQERM